MQRGKILIFAIIILMVSASALQAVTLSPPEKLNQNPSAASSCEEHQICCDNSGNIYACWMDDRRSNGEHTIYFRHGELIESGDVDWDENEKEISIFGSSKFPSIACDDSDHVYIAWIFKGADGLSDLIYVNYSDNNGEDWLYGGKIISGNDDEVPIYSVSITCDNNGHVYVVWNDLRNGPSKIYCDYSSDHCVTWHQDILLGPFDTYQGFFPEISCDDNGENVYAVWNVTRTSAAATGIYFNHSSDFGATWNDFDTLIGARSTKRDRPHIANNSDGNVYVGWIDGRGGDDKVYFNYSHDHGATWQPDDIRISDPTENISALPMGLACQRGYATDNVYAAWSDFRGDDLHVYFDYSEDGGASWNQDKIITNSGGQGGQEVSIDSDNSGFVAVVWVDLRHASSPSIWMNYSMDFGISWPLDNVNVDSLTGTARYPKVCAGRIPGGDPYAAFAWRERTSHFDVYGNTLNFNSSSIAVVPGPGPENKPYVRLFDENGLQMGEDFLAYNLSGFGAEVAGSNLLEGLDEAILAGPGPGPAYGPNVRGFNMEGDLAPGLNFIAYGVRKYGVNVGIGQIDRTDAAGEILTGPGPGEMFGPHVRVWKYDGERVLPLGSGFFAYGVRKFGVKVAGADIDGDGVDEIITAPGPGPVFGAHVKCWKYESGVIDQIAGFLAYGTGKYGVEIGGGDVDGDGRDEILTGPGPSPAYGSHVRGWRYADGQIENIAGINFKAYQTGKYGCKVSSGDADLDPKDELFTLPGPGPQYPAHLRGFHFDEGQVVPMMALNFFAYSSDYKYGGNTAVIETDTYR